MSKFDISIFFYDYFHKNYIVTSNGISDSMNSKFFNLESLFSVLKIDYETLLYKIFYTTYGKTILFVANPNFNNHDTTNQNSTSGFFVKGALFDLDTQNFISNNTKNNSNHFEWLTFYVYDNSIPHIYTDEKSNKIYYQIIFWDKNHESFSLFTATSIQKIISYSGIQTEMYQAHKKQLIFVTANDKKHKKCSSNFNTYGCEEIDANRIMLALTFDLVLICIENRLRFESVCAYHNKNNLNSKVPVFSASIFDKSDASGYFIDNTLYLSDYDIVIFKSYKSEYGEFTLLFLSDGIKIDYFLSCFDYQPFHYFDAFNYKENIEFFNGARFIKITARKNDFENFTRIVDLKTRKIYAKM